MSRQGSQPGDDRTRAIARPDIEFAPNADGLQHRPERIAPGDNAAGRAKEAGTKDGHTLRGDAIGELRDQRMQARHLVDDDHGRPGPTPEDWSRPPSRRIGELEALVSL